jgi:uncharacterized membrane protein
MTICQYKQSTQQYALFKNKVDLFKDFSQKLILTVLSNLFRTLRTLRMLNVLNILKNKNKTFSLNLYSVLSDCRNFR